MTMVEEEQEKEVEQCCAGWTNMPDCQTPVCDPPCQRGTCAAPNTCDCTGTGYTGKLCDTGKE